MTQHYQKSNPICIPCSAGSIIAAMLATNISVEEATLIESDLTHEMGIMKPFDRDRIGRETGGDLTSCFKFCFTGSSWNELD